MDIPKRDEHEITSEDLPLTIITFLRMTKNHNEDLSMYYHRLRLHACGLKADQDRMVRDLLIQAVTDEKVLSLLVQMKGILTAEDVLAKELEANRDLSVWKTILPYLALVDIFNVSECGPRFAKTVDEYLANGNRLTVDDKFLQQRAVANANPCSRFTQAGNIALRNIEDRDVATVVSCFHRIQKLTLINMSVLESAKVLPNSPTEISLVNVKIAEYPFYNWLSTCQGHLHTLTLVNLEPVFCPSRDFTWKLNLQSLCPALQSFHIEGNQIGLGGILDSLRSLKIIARSVFCDFNCFSRLESLHFDCPDMSSVQNTMTRKTLLRLRALTVRTLWETFSWRALRKFKNLESFTVLDGLDWKHKRRLDKCKGRLLLSLEVYFYEYAAAHQENLLLTTLNDDCLLHLTTFLPMKDCIAFAQTHSRIDRIITRHRFRELDTNDLDLYTVLKRNTEFGQRIVPYVRDLALRGWPLTTALLPHVNAHLQHLTLDSFQLEDAVKVTWPETIESFSLIDMSIGQVDVARLVRSFRELRHLKEIGMDSAWTPQMISELLELNRDTLEHISVTVTADLCWETLEIDWALVETMKHFKHFSLKRDTKKGHAHEIRSLYLDSVLAQIGHKLQRLRICCLGVEWTEAIQEGHLGQLQWLDLNVNDEMDFWKWDRICSLKELRTVMLDRNVKGGSITEAGAMQLIKSCDKLTVLGIAHFRASTLFGERLQAYLKKSGRRLDLQ